MLAHEHAHVRTDETGAPGFFGQGLGLIGLPGASGRIDPAALHAALEATDVSYRQSAAALSLTNATEYGTVYTVTEVGALAAAAKARGLPVHLDGARLANAAAAGFDLKAIARLGIDVLVLGGTKAGMPPTEAIVLFDRNLSRRFDARLKQAGQLPSKGRFYAAPWIGMLESGAFLRHAAHANAHGAVAGHGAALRPAPSRSGQRGVRWRWTTPGCRRSTPKAGASTASPTDRCASCAHGATTPEAVEAFAQALKAVA